MCSDRRADGETQRLQVPLVRLCHDVIDSCLSRSLSQRSRRLSPLTLFIFLSLSPTPPHQTAPSAHVGQAAPGCVGVSLKPYALKKKTPSAAYP